MTAPKSEARHTPGPWRAHDDGFVTTDDDAAVRICEVDREGADDPATATADARLIAAAPAMYEALRELLEVSVNMGRPVDPAEWRAKKTEAERGARAALALVEGAK